MALLLLMVLLLQLLMVLLLLLLMMVMMLDVAMLVTAIVCSIRHKWTGLQWPCGSNKNTKV